MFSSSSSSSSSRRQELRLAVEQFVCANDYDTEENAATAWLSELFREQTEQLLYNGRTNNKIVYQLYESYIPSIRHADRLIVGITALTRCQQQLRILLTETPNSCTWELNRVLDELQIFV